ncbi:MAG: hypothetical protein ACLSFW_24805 [Bacteroides cellulosilyticus]
MPAEARSTKNEDRSIRFALHRIEGHTECLIESAEEKLPPYAGEKVADRVANETSVIAEKANDIKGKVHSMADEAKKVINLFIIAKQREAGYHTYTLSVFHYILVIE